MAATLRALALLVAVCALGVVVVLELAHGRDADRRAARDVDLRLAAVEIHAAAVDLALADHEAWTDETADAYRQRCTWEMAPARTRGELIEAVLLRPERGTPVLVDIVGWGP